eukprot:3385885-Rhodomonas_salina.1
MSGADLVYDPTMCYAMSGIDLAYEPTSTCTPAFPALTCQGLPSITLSPGAYSQGPWQQCKACSQSTRPVLPTPNSAMLLHLKCYAPNMPCSYALLRSTPLCPYAKPR